MICYKNPSRPSTRFCEQHLTPPPSCSLLFGIEMDDRSKKSARLVFATETLLIKQLSYFSLCECFFFSTLPPVFYFLAILACQSQASVGLQLMTSHVCKHHSATKAWKNDRSAFQFVLTNKLVRRCHVLHNRCGGCRGMEPVMGEGKRKWPCPIWAREEAAAW